MCKLCQHMCCYIYWHKIRNPPATTTSSANLKRKICIPPESWGTQNLKITTQRLLLGLVGVISDNIIFLKDDLNIKSSSKLVSSSSRVGVWLLLLGGGWLCFVEAEVCEGGSDDCCCSAAMSMWLLVGWLAVGCWRLAVGCWLLRYADTDTLMCAVLVIARPLLLVVVQHSCCWCWLSLLSACTAAMCGCCAVCCCWLQLAVGDGCYLRPVVFCVILLYCCGDGNCWSLLITTLNYDWSYYYVIIHWPAFIFLLSLIHPIWLTTILLIIISHCWWPPLMQTHKSSYISTNYRCASPLQPSSYFMAVPVCPTVKLNNSSRPALLLHILDWNKHVRMKV